jgi:hypothetical protein
MRTKAKNAIFAMIEATNDHSIHNYKVEDVTQSRDEDGKLNWSFSVYQVEHNQETGAVRYRELLSNPTEIIPMADAMLVGSYVTVDTIGTPPEDWEAKKLVKWGKPYIRLY